MHKILRDFGMHMDHPVQAKLLNLVLIDKKKRTCLLTTEWR